MIENYSVVMYEGELLGALFAMLEVVIFLLCTLGKDESHNNSSEAATASNAE